MEEKMSGIVLGGISFGENDKILKIFTLEQGVVSAKIKGVKKAGAKLKFASEPFCFAEFIFSKRGDLRTVIGASLIESFYPVREDISKYFCAGAIVEFIKKFYREDIVSPETFFTVVSALKSIAYGDIGAKASLVNFFVSALKISGFALSFNGCSKCEGEIDGRIFFDYRSGAFYCEKCFDGTGREVSILTYKALQKAEKGVLEENDEGTLKALKLIEYYLEMRADENLNSLKELIKISG
ncbi:MAG: DNA repair protein RecO [Clostridiales bacterium]|nr:DNA repair protein RecO [Clostridiales bacterium]